MYPASFRGDDGRFSLDTHAVCVGAVVLAYGVYYLAFCIPALFFLRGRVLDDTSRAVWALAIVLAPIMGALALVIIQPGPREG